MKITKDELAVRILETITDVLGTTDIFDDEGAWDNSKEAIEDLINDIVLIRQGELKEKLQKDLKEARQKVKKAEIQLAKDNPKELNNNLTAITEKYHNELKEIELKHYLDYWKLF